MTSLHSRIVEILHEDLPVYTRGWLARIATRILAAVADHPGKAEGEAGFADLRCRTCGHATESHQAGRGHCYGCPPERRCVGYVLDERGGQ